MTRVPALLAPVLAAALWPDQGHAQEGPSFNCRYAQTATETAICTNPDLARLEMRMFESYLGLVDAVGERRARRIADRFLERRQACGGDADCIARRLVITMRVFERRSGGGTEMAAREPSDDELSGLEEVPEIAAAAPPVIAAPPVRPERAPIIEEAPPLAGPALIDDDPPGLAPPPEAEVASIEAPAAESDLPLAAQAPLPPDLDPLLDEGTADESTAEGGTPEEIAAAEPPPSPAQIEDTLEGAQLTSTYEAASFDTPVSWAFMDLIRHQRADIQTRLQAAGYYEGPAEGSWDQATLDAFDAFFASEEGQGFDPTTENGAALAIDFIRSDAFAETHGLATEGTGNDPLTSTEW